MGYTDDLKLQAHDTYDLRALPQFKRVLLSGQSNQKLQQK